MQFGSYFYQMLYMGPAGWAVFISTVLVLLGSCVWWSFQQPSSVPAPIAVAKPTRGRAQPYIDTPAQVDPSLKPRSPAAKPPASPTDGAAAEVANGAGAEAAPAEDKAAPAAAVPQDPLQRAHARAEASRTARKLAEQEAAAKAEKEQHAEPLD